MRSDAEQFQPLGAPLPRDPPKQTPQHTIKGGILTTPDGKKQTVTQQRPMNIADMDMIRKDIGDVPVPWGILACRGSWEVFYLPGDGKR